VNCQYCAVGFHFLCMNILSNKDVVCCCVVEETSPIQESTTKLKGKVGRPEKDIGEFDDQLSSGRKRAARKFTIEPGTVCEWAWKKFNGGGIEPVFGCSGRTARHIHHGPDKSTLNNDRATNISIVCTFCHQLWHARNDKYFLGNRPPDGSTWLPTSTDSSGVIHSLSESEAATANEITEFEMSIDREMSVEDWTRIRERTISEQSNEQSTTGEIVEGAKG